jgi:hypothetical protein
VILQLEDETPGMQCGHTSGNCRGLDTGHSESGSVYSSTTSRSISKPVIVQREGETSMTQCDHIGRSNTSGSYRGSDIGHSDSARDYSSANSRSINERMIVQMKGKPPVSQYDQTGGSNTSGIRRGTDTSHSDNASVYNSAYSGRTEETTTHPANVPFGSSCSGEPEHWSPEDDDDTRTAAENNNTYPIDVPLADSFHCRICAPIPKWYKRHGDLSNHIRRYHARQLIFRCHGCSEVFATLKGCKRHQISTDCGKLPVITRSPLQPPQSQ